MSDDDPLSVHAIIQTLSAPPVSLATRKAMEAARLLFPLNPTTLSLSKITEKTLKELGIKETETRKAIKAAWPKIVNGKGKKKEIKVGPPSPPKKRKRSSGRLDMFEIHDPDAEASSSSFSVHHSVAQLDFGESIPEEKLLKVSFTVNRAPTMTAWAMIICLRLGFSKEEALSLASVYTEMNATSRAISLGIQQRPKGPTLEDELRSPGNTLPYVDLMGRRIPVVAREDETWRAILNSGEICQPTRAAKYLLSSFPSHLPSLLRSLTLLADSHSPPYLQTEQGGFQLYMLFRPNPTPPTEVAGGDEGEGGKGAKGKGRGKPKPKQEMSWGGKGVLRMEEVLSLRGVEVREAEKEVKEEEEEEEEQVKQEGEEEEEPSTSTSSRAKRSRRTSSLSSTKKIVYKEEDPDDYDYDDEDEQEGEMKEESREEEEVKVEEEEVDEDDSYWGDLKDEDLPFDL